MPGEAELISMAGQSIDSLLSPISKYFLAKKQEKLGKAYIAERGQYQFSPFIRSNIALANNAYNGRMAGATQAEQNIQAAQANQVAGAARAATSGAQLLAVGAGAEGQSDEALANLQQQEAIQKQQASG
jgi:hypothetical protein